MKYIYDVENRLIRVEDGTGSIIATYYYDPFGRRLWKEVNGNRTYYFYSVEGLIGEYDNTGSEIKTYGYKPDSTWTTDPVFMKQGGEYYFYHNDHIGTPQKITDTSGNIVWAATYDSFGKAQISVSDITNNLRFPGQYYDAETGLHYNWFRYYDSATGRYLTADPIGFMGGDVNLYAYVGNNAVNYTDPSGLRCFNFNKFANQVEQNRASNALTLGSLMTDLAIGTMPKTPIELRSFGPASMRNPYTSQLSRWSGRFGTRALRELGRTTAGVVAGAIATGAVVFEGFYDWGVIGKAAWDATLSDDCGCQGR